MRKKTINLNAVSASPGIPLNQYASEFNVGFGVIKTGGGDITYSVEHTYDGENWFEHSIVSGKTGNAEGVYVNPVEQVRLNVTVVSGDATASMTIIQQDY